MNHPNLVYFMIDSLRFDAINAIEPREKGFLDHQGLRGAVATDAFDYLVEDGASIPRLHAPFAATPPSTASALTGLYPREHGICGFNRPLADDVTTLPECLSEAGYHTILMNGINVFEINGMGDRFDEYIYGSIDDLTRRVKEVNRDDQPAFVFFHTMDVHRPYFLSRYPVSPSAHRLAMKFLDEWSDQLDVEIPQSLADTFTRPDDKVARYKGTNTPAWEAMLEFHYHYEDGRMDLDNPVGTLSRMYLRGIQWFDEHHLSRYVDFLKDYEEDTVTVVTGDHGETSRILGGEPSFYHGGKPVQDLIRVPGIISGAGLESDVFEDWELTSLVDVLPTIIDLLGLEDTGKRSGLSLLGDPPRDREVYTEFSQQLHDQDFPRDAVLNWHSVLNTEGFKYYRQALPLEEEDYELPFRKFIEIAVRKLKLSVPGEQFYERWESLAEEADEEELKRELVEQLESEGLLEEPELYEWSSDHLENDNVIDEYPEEADRLDRELVERFPDPAELAWQEADRDVDQEQEEEVIEGLKGLGYL